MQGSVPMAVKGHNYTPSPLFWRPKPHHQCHIGGSLSQPVTLQPTSKSGVPAHPWGLPRHQVHLPVALAWTPSLLGYLFRAKATLEAKGVPEAESCWSRVHIETLSSLLNPVQLAFLCPHASQDASAAAGPEHPFPRLGCDKYLLDVGTPGPLTLVHAAAQTGAPKPPPPPPSLV